MRLFAVHVAEKHIDRLMRECDVPLLAPGRMSLYVLLPQILLELQKHGIIINPKACF